MDLKRKSFRLLERKVSLNFVPVHAVSCGIYWSTLNIVWVGSILENGSCTFVDNKKLEVRRMNYLSEQKQQRINKVGFVSHFNSAETTKYHH